VNLKQSGRNSVHLPISYRFDPPIVVPDGKLSALIITKPAQLLSGMPYECLNTELHLTIDFQARPTDVSQTPNRLPVDRD
jgi:hypothetical protein